MKLRGIKVLTIDDADAIHAFLRVYMRAMGAFYYEARTGQSGIELCEFQKPDVVILDIGLPDMNGLDVLSRIREIKSEYRPLVIILTLRKSQSTKNDAYERGADAYLSKPFEVEDILDVLNEKLQLPLIGNKNSI
jgi:DNA-binding response OmpR family regulator